MRSRRSQAGLIAVALVLLAGTVTGVSVAVTAGSARQPATDAANRQPPSSVTVALATGDRVQVDSTGAGYSATGYSANGAPVPATAGGGSFVEYTEGKDQYVVPAEVVPYLHSTVDPRLFDVTYLAKAGLVAGKAGGVPVTVTYASGTAAPAALPGLTVGKRTGNTASATLDRAQSAKLGQALADQWRAVRSGQSTLPVGTLPGISRIALSGTAAGDAAPPAGAQQPAAGSAGLPFHTLTLKFIDLTGAPGSFFGAVQNVDDLGRANSLVNSSATLLTGTGSFSVSVPAGTYSLEFSVLTPHASDPGFDTALVVKPQVIVDADQTVSLDARTAVPYQANSDRPIPATTRTDAFNFSRLSATGGALGVAGKGATGGLLWKIYAISPPPVPGLISSRLLATPTAPVTEGGFGFAATTMLANTIGGDQGQDPAYIYDFPSAGRIPSSLTYTVPSADLTTVHEHIYDSPTNRCSRTDDPGPNVNQLLNGRIWAATDWGFSVTAGSRTDYWYTSDPKLDLWEPTLNAAKDCPEQALRRTAGPRRLSHGGQISEDWNKAPLVPAPVAPFTDGQDPLTWVFQNDPNFPNDLTRLACPACRQDNNGLLYLTRRGDSVPTHYTWQFYGFADQSSKVWFYRDGALALTSDAELEGWLLPVNLNLAMLPAPATYRLDWIWASPADPAATTETDWTFRSSPTDPAAKLPPEEQCAPDASRACSFLPLLFLTYDLALDDQNRASAGAPFTITFTVGAQQHAPAPTNVSTTVSVSFDDGKTWSDPQPADMKNGEFSTTINHPPLGETTGYASLRVVAHDGAGNAVTQTLIRAYGLAD
ncbi:MAG: hypothetical protein J2P15_07050 [Micromonosporaceae bacterium]|nr:hypothetical protein [Micromonosporaceae bacterium]